MTGRMLLEQLASHPGWVAGALALPPLLALVLPLVHGRGQGERAPFTQAYSLVVYLTCVPGMLASVLTAHSLFLGGPGLLDADWILYLLPIVAMAVTLLLVRQRVRFAVLPGFDRLSGLMVLLGVSFVLALAVARTRIWLVFGGSIGSLAVLAGGLFALLRWGAHTAFRGRGEPRRDAPRFPTTL